MAVTEVKVEEVMAAQALTMGIIILLQAIQVQPMPHHATPAMVQEDASTATAQEL